MSQHEVKEICRKASMTKLVVCVLLVDDDKEEVQQLLRTSMPIDDPAFLESASIQEMWKAVAKAAQPAKSSQAGDAPVLRVRDLTIDRARRLVTLGKEEMHLTPTEYELISLLAARAGAVLSHEHLLREIWGAIDAHTLHLLRVNISNLRRKLNGNGAGKLNSVPSAPQYIATEPGIGYRLRADL